MFGKENKEVKYEVKLHPLFNKANTARDVVSGKTFQTNNGTVIESKDWDRLKEKTWTLDGKSYPLLILVEEIVVEDDEETTNDYVDVSDIEEIAENGSVLQDTEVEEE